MSSFSQNTVSPYEFDSKKQGNDNTSVTSSQPNNATVEEERGQWGNPVEFILSCLGYAVGLGNVWRFPYLVYTNGGGAFLIPYIIMMTFVGLPLFFIELIIGQYSSSGPMDIWTISPIFKGAGAGMLAISAISSIYYNMILAWSLYYLFASWQAQVPWYDCKNDWNTHDCYTKREAEECEKSQRGNVWFNLTCYNATEIEMNEIVIGDNCTSNTATNSSSFVTCVNLTQNPLHELLTNATKNRKSASEEYYLYRVLDLSPSIDDTGEMKWELVLVLLLSWVICFLCVIRGIKSSGKVVYFTATFPYVILIILLIRGALLEGADDGVHFYIVPDWEKLGTAKVWVDAAGQVFFSLSVGMGGLMTFASYNPFKNNVYRDTLIVVILDAFTSIFAGFAIFCILGHLAHTLGQEVQDVVKSGSGLAFVAYPEVVTYLEPPQLWSTLFFLMLITLAIDSQFATVETCMTTIVDALPILRRWKPFVAAGISVIMFLLGLTMCTQAGLYWVDLMSYYSSGWSLVLIALVEAIVFPWVYGANRLIDDLERMVGFRLYKHWWFCWKFISPLLLIGILIFNIIDFTPLAFGDYVLPSWSQALGWLMALVSVIMIPIFAVHAIWKSYSQPEYYGLNFGNRLVKLTQATDDWKPAHEKVNRPKSINDLEMKTEGDSTEIDEKHKSLGLNGHQNHDNNNTTNSSHQQQSKGSVNAAFQQEDETKSF